VAAGFGHSARKVKKNARIIEIVLDDGFSVRCTEDHLVMVRSGQYVMAKDLIAGQSLMPLYRRHFPIKEDSELDYEQVLDMATNEWKFTHRLVLPRCPRGQVRHHVNFNRFDNTPGNLELKTWEEHRLIHQNAIDHARRSPRFKEVQRRKMLAIAESRRGKPRPKHWKKPGLRPRPELRYTKPTGPAQHRHQLTRHFELSLQPHRAVDRHRHHRHLGCAYSSPSSSPPFVHRSAGCLLRCHAALRDQRHERLPFLRRRHYHYFIDARGSTSSTITIPAGKTSVTHLEDIPTVK
jgi:hypothetical protein